VATMSHAPGTDSQKFSTVSMHVITKPLLQARSLQQPKAGTRPLVHAAHSYCGEHRSSESVGFRC
jgi:hypothetical protein